MSNENNVFISWSGERSFAIAKVLRQWLPGVVQAARPWMSDTDIEKGTRGLNEIAKALTGIKVGIICLTPENLTESWILFEAGALSKTISDDKTRLCTYLLGGLAKSDIKQPLGMFQHTLPEMEETRNLVHAINRALNDTPVPREILNTVFDSMWPKLESAIATLPEFAPSVIPKRDTRDMVEEILELVRAEANARTSIPPFNFVTQAFPTADRLNLGYAARPTMFSSDLMATDTAIMPPAAKDTEQAAAKKQENKKG